MSSSNINSVLSQVKEYIATKQASEQWVPGKDWVKYSGPYFGPEEYVAAVESLLGGWLVLGNEATKFEKKCATILGKNEGILVNSGSSANLLMVAALKKYLSSRAEIVVPVAGFPTTLNPIIQNGYRPVFVDIELDSLNIDTNLIPYGVNIEAIMFAHVLGNSPNMDALMDVSLNSIILEDCCDALGSTYNDKPLGSFGNIASCSFYPAHHITMGEGGLVATSHPEFEKIIRSLREWGRDCYCVGKASLLKDGTCGCRFSNWLPLVPNDIFDHKYVYTQIGYNLKPIELQAAIGNVQLKKLPEIVTKRRNNYNQLLNIFKPYEEYFHLHLATKKCNPSWFAFPLTIRDGAGFNRFEFCSFLEDAKIQTRQYFAGNLLLQPAYKAWSAPYEEIKKQYPVATKVTSDTLFLGTSPVISDEQIDYIEEKVDEFFKDR